MAEVSIIVPVYNAEKTIRRCIESIINQEYIDFELILCDDGSTDVSGAICDEYQEKDERIRVLHKPNTGVSDTRNQGIAMAQGTYIQFLDADDWITVDATKLLVRTMKEKDCDLVISDFYRVVGERTSHKGDIEDEDVLSREAFAQYMMENPADFYYGVLWNKLFKREIIEAHQIQMDEHVNWCEDFLFNLEYLIYCNRIAALQVPIYYYVKTEGSLASQGMNIGKAIKMKISVFEYYNAFYKHVYEDEDYSKRRLGVYRFLFDMATDGFVMPPFFSGTKKLGEERTGSYVNEQLADNIFTVQYQQKKLVEQYLEAIALRYDLELRDVVLLTHILNNTGKVSKKALADYTGYTIGMVSRILQKLVMKKVIEVKTYKKKMDIGLSNEYASLYREFEHVKQDYEAICFQGFSEEDIDIYRRLSAQSCENIKKVLVIK